MCHHEIRHPFAVEDVSAMVHHVFAGRVSFHDGDSELAPEITLHCVGGHSDGLQIVRASNARGWVVLASDAAHFYANIEQERPYPVLFHVGDMMAGYQTVKRLAETADHIVSSHDPLVRRRYPALSPETEGWIVRVDLPSQNVTDNVLSQEAS